MSLRSEAVKYFFSLNCFSNSKICRPVNVVLAFFFLTFSLTDFPFNLLIPLEWAEEVSA